MKTRHLAILLTLPLLMACNRDATNEPAAEPTTEPPQPTAEPESPQQPAAGEQPPAEGAAAPAEVTAGGTVKRFSVDPATSKLEFMMAAPLENIHGVANNAVHGSLDVDLNDLTNTSGTLRFDLDQLVLYQSKRENDTDAFPTETKNEKQNEHMKTWFQISPDAPAKVREQNRWITFEVTSVTRPTVQDITSMEGDARPIRAQVNGVFTLHGKPKNIGAYLAATFHFKDNEPQQIHITSMHPVGIRLAEHDIHPRSTFDKLAQKTLAALGQKVAEAAPVTFDFKLKP